MVDERGEQAAEVGGLTTTVGGGLRAHAVEVDHQDLAARGIAYEVLELEVAVAQAVRMQAPDAAPEGACGVELGGGVERARLQLGVQIGTRDARREHETDAVMDAQRDRRRCGDAREAQAVARLVEAR